MFARLFSLILIAVIVACPMRCGDGLCQAAECCPLAGMEKQSVQDSCPSEAKAGCHCCHSSPVEDEPVPSECPEKTACQGVCGGAVVEGARELADLEDVFFLSPVDVGRPAACSSLPFEVMGTDVAPDSGSQYGRSLRALHMSFLC